MQSPGVELGASQETSMHLTSQKTTNYLLGGMAIALTFGYALKAPDLTAEAERKSLIPKQEKGVALDRQSAMQRAQRCVILLTELPITDGTAAYFSSSAKGQIVIHKNRPMPNGTTVCDYFGNTGVVEVDAQGTPIVTDIKQMPPEEMEAILQKRLPKTQKLPNSPHQIISK